MCVNIIRPHQNPALFVSVNGVVHAVETLLGAMGVVVGLYNREAKNARYV